MNILIPDSWLREYLKTKASPKQIKDYLSLCGPTVEKITQVENDCVYTVEITSNRIDMTSVYGIAREAAAILPRFNIQAQLKKLEIPPPSLSKKILPLEISDPERLCDRILAITLDNVRIGPSRDFIRKRLERSGVRSLNNVIDITNYVMLELGHPCHVFDYDRIKTAKLILRKAKKGEVLVTLDDKKCLLDKDDIVIDDGTGRIVDLPGIIGTKNSVVTSQTKRIVVFIESNKPVNIRKTSMRLALRTLAATINEKHPNPELAKTTILKAVLLYKDILKAKEAGNLIDIFPKPFKSTPIKLTTEFINKRLGTNIPPSEIVSILKTLHFEVERKNINKLIVTPPSFRQFDVTIPEDIVEEVARIWGYHNLPSKLMSGDFPIGYKAKDLLVEKKIKQILKYWGYMESYNYSLISEEMIKKAELSQKDHLRLSNPLSEELKYLRISLIPSMLETVVKNQNLDKKLYFFEQAKVYIPKKNDLPKEISMLVIAEQSNFYKLKGTVEKLLEEIGVANLLLSQKPSHFWHPQQVVHLTKQGRIIATLGKLHPKIKSSFFLKKDLYIAEVNVEKITDLAQQTKKFTPIPIYPAIVEDISFLCPSKTQIGPIIKEMYEISSLINKVELFDRYKNTVTFRVSYLNHRKNLTSEEIKAERRKILRTLQHKFSIILKQKKD